MENNNILRTKTIARAQSVLASGIGAKDFACKVLNCYAWWQPDDYEISIANEAVSWIAHDFNPSTGGDFREIARTWALKHVINDLPAQLRWLRYPHSESYINNVILNKNSEYNDFNDLLVMGQTDEIIEIFKKVVIYLSDDKNWRSEIR